MTRTSSFLLVGVAIAGTACCLSSGQCADKAQAAAEKADLEISQARENQLAKWKPDHEDLRSVLGKIFQPKTEIVGDWESRISYEGSSLSIRREASGGYLIDFETGGCQGFWSLERQGTYMDGILRLNKAVEEYAPSTYDTLYAVSFNGKDYLISQSWIRFLVKNYSQNGVVDWSKHLRIGVFHRNEKATNKASKWNGENRSAGQRPFAFRGTLNEEHHVLARCRGRGEFHFVR